MLLVPRGGPSESLEPSSVVQFELWLENVMDHNSNVVYKKLGSLINCSSKINRNRIRF